MTEPIRYELTKLVHLAQMALSARAVGKPSPLLNCVCYLDGPSHTTRLRVDGGFWRANGSFLLCGALANPALSLRVEFDSRGMLRRIHSARANLETIVLADNDLVVKSTAPTEAKPKKRLLSQVEKRLEVEVLVVDGAAKAALRNLLTEQKVSIGRIVRKSGGTLSRSSAYRVIGDKAHTHTQLTMTSFLEACGLKGRALEEWLQQWTTPVEKDSNHD